MYEVTAFVISPANIQAPMPDRLLDPNRLFDAEDFFKLCVQLGLDLLVVSILVRGIYARLYKKDDHVFTYYLFNIVTFSMAFLLRKVSFELGFALGLFAVFGILRYRTEAIGLRDLTYLFISIGLAIINASANKKISWAELALVDAVILGMIYVLELMPSGRRESSIPVLYDRLDLLDPPRRQELLSDLLARTGRKATRIEIDRVDLLRDTAQLTLFFPTDSEKC